MFPLNYMYFSSEYAIPYCDHSEDMGVGGRVTLE